MPGIISIELVVLAYGLQQISPTLFHTRQAWLKVPNKAISVFLCNLGIKELF